MTGVRVMQNPLRGKRFPGFELHKLIELHVSKTRRPAQTGPGNWPHLVERHDVSENSAPTHGGVA